MEEKDFDKLLENVATVEDVVSAFICSRAGAYFMGNPPKMADRGMYSAITSLAFGTAEQVGHEMNDDLQFVSLNFCKRRLLVLGIGPRHLMGMLVENKADVDGILEKVRSWL
jgi:predicted regulator of Ras-like GTPase activity (Roadblock/LC7/MglB family)